METKPIDYILLEKHDFNKKSYRLWSKFDLLFWTKISEIITVIQNKQIIKN